MRLLGNKYAATLDFGSRMILFWGEEAIAYRGPEELVRAEVKEGAKWALDCVPNNARFQARLRAFEARFYVP